jgi:hypothetical protein
LLLLPAVYVVTLIHYPLRLITDLLRLVGGLCAHAAAPPVPIVWYPEENRMSRDDGFPGSGLVQPPTCEAVFASEATDIQAN